ncbi:MAG: glycoside hydrolase family 30 beta sandwich domain-containing protein [Novosphingobium sp.]|uniref:glycoside hydrolase family 30 protein n=1 Tax=Novosphingobium sp. TaxID=1874826 RepID=UPI0032B7C365
MKPLPALARGLAAMALVCLLAACSTSAGPKASGPAPSGVAIWASSTDAVRRLERQADIPLSAAPTARDGDVRIDPGRQDQEIVGYGAAMTDASALLIQNVLTLAERQRLISELFGVDGLALNLLRVPIGASDFSPSHYSLDDVPAGTSDPSLAGFSMAKPLEAQIPALQAARKVNPGLVLMASPWSAPGWMKDSGSLIKGQLKLQNYDAFARYFVRYLDAMDQALLPVRYVTVQNEPAFEPADYPGMRFAAADRARFVAQHLGPALTARGTPVGILEWDHNWDKPEEPLAVLGDSAARAHVSGVAWHCYAGDPAVMAQVHRAWPDKDVFFSECSGGDWAPDWGGSLGWMTDNLIIAPTRAGSRGSILWNLALDENHGPRLGGCGNCRGVVTIDSRTHAITRNVEYYVLGHVSRFVRPGARRIASDGGPGGLTHAAFRNPDGSLVLLAHNASKAILRLTVAGGGQGFATDIPAGDVMTFVWREQVQRP